MAKYRVKPRLVEALQWDGDFDKMYEFTDPRRHGFPGELSDNPIGVALNGRGVLAVFGSLGAMMAVEGDWVVKRPNNDLRVVSQALFPSSFEEVPPHAVIARTQAIQIATDAARRHRDDKDSSQWPPEWVLDAVMDAFGLGTRG